MPRDAKAVRPAEKSRVLPVADRRSRRQPSIGQTSAIHETDGGASAVLTSAPGGADRVLHGRCPRADGRHHLPARRVEQPRRSRNGDRASSNRPPRAVGTADRTGRLQARGSRDGRHQDRGTQAAVAHRRSACRRRRRATRAGPDPSATRSARTRRRIPVRCRFNRPLDASKETSAARPRTYPPPPRRRDTSTTRRARRSPRPAAGDHRAGLSPPGTECVFGPGATPRPLVRAVRRASS